MQNTFQFCAQGGLYKQRPLDHPSITGKKDQVSFCGSQHTTKLFGSYCVQKSLISELKGQGPKIQGGVKAKAQGKTQACTPGSAARHLNYSLTTFHAVEAVQHYCFLISFKCMHKIQKQNAI